jgi:hypothetical protein
MRRAGKVDVRQPGKGNSSSHGSRSVHLIIMMIYWIRTSRLSIKNSLFMERGQAPLSQTPNPKLKPKPSYGVEIGTSPCKPKPQTQTLEKEEGVGVGT